MDEFRNKLFPQYSNNSWENVNLNQLAKKTFVGCVNPLLNAKFCSEWVKIISRGGLSYGGYMEDRSWLWRDHYHFPGHTTHVGIDYNVPAGSLVRSPFSKFEIILIEKDQDNDGGWGTRVVYKLPNDLYVMFAHLSNVYGQVGESYDKPFCVGNVGNIENNGGWYPHLHVQCMRKYEPFKDGYLQPYKGMMYDYPNPENLIKEES